MTYGRSVMISNSKLAHKITWVCTFEGKLNDYYYHTNEKMFFYK